MLRNDLKISFGIFGLTLLPRLIMLQYFITADEAKWIYRSAQFWLAFLAGDWAGTLLKPKPAVTTMWSGGLGLWGYNLWHDNFPFAEFLATIPEWSVNPAMLQAARLPTVFLSAFTLILIYHLLKFWFPRKSALFICIILSLEPLFLAHSRFLHHDALATIFAVPALLLAIQSAQSHTGNFKALIASGILAGLAFLTKSPLFFLVPFVLCLFIFVGNKKKENLSSTSNRQRPTIILQPFYHFMLWGLISYLTFIVLWPAAWVDPIGAPLAVIANAWQESVQAKPARYFVDWGSLYYGIHFLFYSTPVTLLGLTLWWRYRSSLSVEQSRLTYCLILFALTFIILMTLSDKRSVRYILPAFLPATIVASIGWHHWLQTRSVQKRQFWLTGILALQLWSLAPSIPYYITYLNPLLGGSWTAPHIIKLGWGEGMERIGAWLNQQPHIEASRIGSNYASTLQPFVAGRVRDPAASNLDYVVSYIKQRQGIHPAVKRYLAHQPPLYTVRLNGIAYAHIYPGPGLQILPENSLQLKNHALIAYRLHQHFAPIGDRLKVDLIWHIETQPSQTPTLRLRRPEGSILAEGAAPNLPIPATLSSGVYDLFVNDLWLTQISARYAQLPAEFESLEANFGDQIRLLGYQPDWKRDGDTLTLALAFQATPLAWADYTLFLHLIDEDGHRLIGHDARPPRPTSQWLKDEVVPFPHPLPLPENFSSGVYRFRLGFYRADTGEALGSSLILPSEMVLD